MSEVVKKLVTELGFKLVDQAALKKYSNTSKDILKTQKETDKAQKETNKATEKGLTLKQKEKQQLKENAKLETEKVKQQTRLELARLKQVEKSDKERNKLILQREKEVNKNKLTQQKRLDNYNKQEEKRKIQQSKLEEQRIKQTERLRQAQAKQEEQRIKTEQLLYRQRQEGKNQRGQERRDIIAGNRAGAYDRKLNFGANQRGSSFDTRMNDILGRKGKMIDPNNPNRIINIPKQQPKQWIDKEQLGQVVTNTAQNIGQKTQDIVMGSIDIMLEYEKRLNELQVRGELKPNQLKDMDKAVKDSAQKWGTNILETQTIGVNLAKTGLQGDMLKFMIEESTMLGRSLGTTPDEAQKILNMTLHQQRENIQTPEARKKGTPITKDKQAIKKASDMLSAAVNYSALDTKDLIFYTKYSGTGAGEKGISFEEYLSNAMIASNKGMIGSAPGTSERKIQQRLYSSLSGMMETQNFKVGKKKGKKGNRLEQAYDLRDFIDKDVSKYAGQDKTGKNYFNQELLLLDLSKGMKKKKLSVLEQANIVEEIGGLTAMEMLTALIKKRSAEEDKMRKGLKDAQKNNETRRTATALMQNPKSQLEKTKTKKDIAMINLGQRFKPEVGMFTNVSNYALDKFNKSEGLQKTGKRLAYQGIGGGIGAGLGAGLGSIVPGLGTLAGGAGGLLLGQHAGAMLHDTIQVLNRDQGIISSIGKGLMQLVGIRDNSTVNTLNQTRNSIISLSNALQQATNGLHEFLPSYQTLSKLGMVNLGVNVQIPYLPGQAPTKKPNYVLSSSMNKSTASRI